MQVPMRVTRHSISLAVAPSDLPATVDIHLEGHRVWSAEVRRGLLSRNVVLRWPEPVRKHLHGRAQLTVVDPASQDVLANRAVRFPGEGRVRITDARGRWLSMNKWNRLGPTLESDAGVQERLIASTQALVAAMEKWGYPVYIVGGTLLGAIRAGQMMAHDDDVDLAWLSEATTMSDVALEGLELERRLQTLGLEVVRHSMAHLQVTYFNNLDQTDYYIDIFTGFYDSGLYNQPFALRGELDRSDLVPPSMVTLNGVELPAPASPEGWLAYAYGPNWRIPDPSFKFVTPPSTIRLFETTFGVYNRQRVWWEKHYEQFDERPVLTKGEVDAARFCDMLPAEAPVLDVGCGDGRLTELIAGRGHPVLGLDYSYEALRLARQTKPNNVEYRYLNFNDRHAALIDALTRVRSKESYFVFGGEMLHCIPLNGQESMMWWLRGVLSDRTFAFFTIYTDPHPRHDTQDPTTWNLSMRTLTRIARVSGLSVRSLGRRPVVSDGTKRVQQTVVIWR